MFEDFGIQTEKRATELFVRRKAAEIKGIYLGIEFPPQRIVFT